MLVQSRFFKQKIICCYLNRVENTVVFNEVNKEYLCNIFVDIARLHVVMTSNVLGKKKYFSILPGELWSCFHVEA